MVELWDLDVEENRILTETMPKQQVIENGQIKKVTHRNDESTSMKNQTQFRMMHNMG